MYILLRLPNWLGDLVMSIGFLRALSKAYPAATVEVIVRKELAELVPYFSKIAVVHAFDREKHRSLIKTYQYGRRLGKNHHYTHYITLPSSFSTAWMGYAVGAKVRVGFRGEGRDLFLSHTYRRPSGLHRVEEYTYLLEKYFDLQLRSLDLRLRLPSCRKSLLPTVSLRIALNFNSASPSKTLPTNLALSYIDALSKEYEEAHFFLLGTSDQRSYNEHISLSRPALRNRLHNYAGRTDLLQLGQLLTEVDLLISTDSGTAHLANSLGCPLLVLLGAGDEKNTGPYVTEQLAQLRASGISCAPCVSITCKWNELYCLLAISTNEVCAATKKLLQ